ncbi:MAG: MBL fold metallo-hydrolase [Bacteroidales bacterium]|jgi:glyoxylase-like metal-dependent hydrolase (beta-lactamase superfamily II)|nr:MBL fold metallo-hydrolase [Bacteroidales bacterium]
MKIQLFNISNFKVDGGAMFGVIPKALWSRVYLCDENNLITLTLNSLIVETEGHVILVDTGWGDKQDEKFFRHVHLHGGEGLVSGLKKRGYSNEDITDVFLTHLHADHCGGCVRRIPGGTGYELVFPGATYHVSRTQWEWASASNLREADAFLDENILPISQSGQINLVDEDGELFKGFSVRMCYGHTPGLMIPVINYNGKKLVYTGDLIPTMAHIPLIWNMSYDIESLKTIEEKKAILQESLDNNYILVFQHDAHFECCNLEMTTKGIRVKDKFNFLEIASYPA